MEETPWPKCVEHSLVVNARPEQIFPLLEDPHSLMGWVTFLRQVQWAQGSGIGAKDRCQLEIAGMKVWTVAQVHVYEKNVRVGRTSVEGMKMRSEIHLAPEGSSTRVEWAISYRPPMGPLGSLMDAMIMHRAIRKEVAASLGKLKRLAESGDRPIPPRPIPHMGVDDLRDALARGTPSGLADMKDPEQFARASDPVREVPRRPAGNADALRTTSMPP